LNIDEIKIDKKFEDRLPSPEDDAFASLVTSILENGIIVPLAVTEDGLLLDGHRRLKAAAIVGVSSVPVRVVPVREGESWDKAVALATNLHRRHLNEAQRADLGSSLLRVERKAAKERQLAGKGSEGSGGRGKKKETLPSVDGKVSRNQSTTAAIVAKSVGVSAATVERVERVKKEDPKLAKEMLDGTITVSQAVQEIKREAKRDELEDVENVRAKAVKGVFDVIVIDPPWQIKKIERDCRPNQVELDYPTMHVDEIGDLAIPVADDCHVFLWTTHRFLPQAFDLLGGWGLKYVCTMVWHKAGGFQPVGLPQFNCEFALYARHGTPQFLSTKAFPLCFNAPRGMHSEKPEEFYETLRRVTAGRRLDMFNRREIEGFDGWGNQVGK
jgi:N6-adenosine-specific RNA methylase IME4